MRVRVKKGSVCYKIGEKEACIKNPEGYKCAGCGRKLKPKEISILGPETKVWCSNSVCRGQAKFLLEAMRNKELKKLEEYCKDENLTEDERIICEEMKKLLEEHKIWRIREDLAVDSDRPQREEK